MIRVVLIDDQTMIRAGLRGILEDAGIAVAGEASDGRAGLALIRAERPDVVLMDLRMPVLDGVSAIRELRADAALSATPVLVLTTFDGDRDVLAALRAGADGFLGKAADPEELVATIEAIASGRASLSSQAARAVIAHLGAQPEESRIDHELRTRIESLTARERDMVIAAAKGLNNQQIARELFISPFTVKTHLNRAMMKLDARDRGQLVAIAYQSGLTRG